MERFGLTDDEMREYKALTEKWRQSTMSKGPPLTAEEEARYEVLVKRTEYQFWPCEKEAREVTKMIDTGFFVENPANEGDARPASMYFEPHEAKRYLKSHPGSRIWTVVDGDDDTQWLAQGGHLVNRFAYLIEDPEWPERMRLVDEAAKILGTKSSSWLKRFSAYLAENHEGELLPWLELVEAGEQVA